MLKSLQEWKEAPVDCMAVSLHYLQMYYSHEIERGKQGLGEYTLHPQFSSVLDLQPPLFSESIYHSQSIYESCSTDEMVHSTCKSCWLRLLYNHLVMGCEREISYPAIS